MMKYHTNNHQEAKPRSIEETCHHLHDENNSTNSNNLDETLNKAEKPIQNSYSTATSHSATTSTLLTAEQELILAALNTYGKMPVQATDSIANTNDIINQYFVGNKTSYDSFRKLIVEDTELTEATKHAIGSLCFRGFALNTVSGINNDVSDQNIHSNVSSVTILEDVS